MKHQFDELAKGLAQSVTRRTALRKFGVGIGLIALAALGLTNKAEAAAGGNGNKNLPGSGEPCKRSRKPPYLVCAPGLVCVDFSPSSPNGICRPG